ncbi:hypothetical protein CAPTEDRAFT_214462 [Capitella teleta]|uniref:Uncharacterized protein n=1 Tax=Capitella teleta TaxID=283909 RepID=R7V000_CAPTE|nr:hypothetical protein CAPTEDRAFT_214462 [Capitella teleta]|eukprot:ELU09011.1 hypothetical protein CAPTEDRAFT_214462 [Capitella teleta]
MENAYTSAKVPDSEKMEPNKYEELQDITPEASSSSQSHPNQQSLEVTSTSLWTAVLSLFKEKGKQEKNPKQSEVPTNTSFKISDVNVPDVEILEENEYEEIRDSSIESSPFATATKQTPDVTYCNTSEKHPTTLDNSASDGNPAISQFEEIRQKINLSKTVKPMPMKPDEKLDFVQVDVWQTCVSVTQITQVLPAVGGSMFDGIMMFCKKEWQNKGIKMFTVTFNNEQLSEGAEYVNQQSGISVLTMDHELTNKAIISLRQNLIPVGRSPKCAIMCKDGTQFSGFFISVSCTLDMVDEGNKMDTVYGVHKFKTVRPDFAPSELNSH